MIGATVQLIAAFLGHTTLGINALVAGIPNYELTAPGDTPVQRTSPPTVPIYNDVEHDGLTERQGYRPPEFPAIIVFRAPQDIEGSTSLRETKRDPSPRTVIVVIAYVTDEKANRRTAQDDCEVLLRAAEGSLRRYKQQTNAAGYRELNGIHVMDILRWKRTEETTALDVTRFWGWLEVELQVIDSIA